jgi:hypothetical protein
LLKTTDLPFAPQIHEASICVKIDGTPVKFRAVYQKGKDKTLKALLLDPISNPGAKVVARFCTGKSVCSEDCKVPRDEFLDALGAAGDDSKSATWESGKSDAHVLSSVDGALKRELEAGSDYEISDRWKHEAHQPTCIGKIKEKVERTVAHAKH